MIKNEPIMIYDLENNCDVPICLTSGLIAINLGVCIPMSDIEYRSKKGVIPYEAAITINIWHTFLWNIQHWSKTNMLPCHSLMNACALQNDWLY